MKPELFRLLLAACFCLPGLVVSVVLLFRDQRRKAQRNTRIDGVAEAYRQSRSGLAVATGGLGLSRRPEGARLASKLAELLRYDPAHRAIHPAPLSAVLTLSLIPSLMLAYFVVNFIGPIGWAAVPVLSALLCRGFYGWFEDRLVATLFRQFPDALAMIVRAVRVGLPIVEAIRVVARENAEPTAREFTALVAQTAIGVPLDDALREMAERNRLPEYRFFATALSLQSQTGGGLTETLENLADTIRKRVAARLRGHALAAEARMSSYILGALPLVAGAMLSAVNPGYMAVLFTDPSGRTLLLIATAMLLGGAFIMRTMIRKSLT
jgi:tight adherence protein B